VTRVDSFCYFGIFDDGRLQIVYSDDLDRFTIASIFKDFYIL